MCGRYYLHSSLDKLIKRYGINIGPDFDYSARPEIFPSENAPVLIAKKTRELQLLKWGFIPVFSNRIIINARSETLEHKSLFKRSLRTKRCLIPANGFFEWKKVGRSKIKYRISPYDQGLFSLAGLYDTFIDKKGDRIECFTIITGPAGEKMRDIHERMPVILHKETEKYWLEQHLNDISTVKELLKPYPEELLSFSKDNKEYPGDQLKLDF